VDYKLTKLHLILLNVKSLGGGGVSIVVM